MIFSDKDLEAVAWCLCWLCQCHTLRCSSVESVRLLLPVLTLSSSAVLRQISLFSKCIQTLPAPSHAAGGKCFAAMLGAVLGSTGICSACAELSATFPWRVSSSGCEFLPWCHVYPKAAIECGSWGFWLKVGRFLFALKECIVASVLIVATCGGRGQFRWVCFCLFDTRLPFFSLHATCK